MDSVGDKPATRLGAVADRTFLNIEVSAYVLLAFLLAAAAALGIWNAGALLFAAIRVHTDSDALVVAIDRLLFVLMVVEILHTVRVSFRSGTLVAEPFLVVGLIASIRRVLVITLESSQANQMGKWTPEAQLLLHSTMLELAVLGGLILVLVVSIFLMRWSRRLDKRS
jgi:uncharacterized membrane protein (DUF373 family)